MTDLRRRLLEDRALRDSARSIITQQAERLRTGVSGKWIGEAMADRYGDRMLDIASGTRRAMAGKGKLIVGAGAVAAAAAVAWLARKPLMDLLPLRAQAPEAESNESEPEESGADESATGG